VSGRAVALVACGLLLVGCGGPYAGTTLGQQVQSWVQSAGFPGTLSTLRADARRVVAVHATGNTKALHTDCDVLVDDALSANQQLPTPDGTLTRLLSDAYATAAQAGRGCAFAAATDAPAWARARGELDRAATGYIKAQARVDDVE
jgi:hypothetical protein